MIFIRFEDGREIMVPKDVFRRILVLSKYTLQRLKKNEEKVFPEEDLIALNVIEAIQLQYVDMI